MLWCLCSFVLMSVQYNFQDMSFCCCHRPFGLTLWKYVNILQYWGGIAPSALWVSADYVHLWLEAGLFFFTPQTGTAVCTLSWDEVAVVLSWHPWCWIYQGADKSLARPGRKQARKHVRDTRDFNNIETRSVIKFFFLQGKALNEIHAILTETLASFLPGWAKDLSAPLYEHIQFFLLLHRALCRITLIITPTNALI